MANPHRGGVSIRSGADDLTLSFSTNAMCELEDAADMPILQVVARLQDRQSIRMTLLRQVVWAALRDHHPDVSIEKAGDILTTVGINVMVPKLGEAMTLAFPAAEAVKSGKANPRKAARA